MFDRYVLTDGSLKNVVKDGKAVGYSMQSQISYYRGIPCSMIHDVKIRVDGVDVPREKISFSPDGGKNVFTLDELETVTTYKWEYGEKGLFIVSQEGGLTPGEHEVMLMTVVRVDYIPFPFEGVRTKVMTVE